MPGRIVVVVAWLAAAAAAPSSAQPSKATPAQLARWSAGLLAAGNVAEARKYCDAALTADPSLVGCLDDLIAYESAKAGARRRVVAAENEARQRVGAGDEALKALSAEGIKDRPAAELDAIAAAMGKLQPSWRDPRGELFRRAVAGWAFDLVFVAAFLLVIWAALAIARRVRRLARSRARWQWLPGRTRWVLRPLSDDTSLGVTGLLADALFRVKTALQGRMDVPTLLTLRPIAGHPDEPEVWRDFAIAPPLQIREIEQDVALRFDHHDVELADAFDNLQVKVGGFDISALAKFAKSVRGWFDVGVPTLSGGVVVTAASGGNPASVLIRVTRLGDGYLPASLLSSTEHVSAADAAFLAAERAAYKLMYLIARPDCSSIDVDGLAARRQALTLLQRWVTAGGGEERRLALEKAVVNLRYARDVVHIGTIRNRRRFSLGEPTPQERVDRVTRLCELYLYEAIAHALLYRDHQRVAALEASGAGAAVPTPATEHPTPPGHSHLEQALGLLREIEESADPAVPEQRLIRLQALYNHAVLEQRQSTPQSLERALEMYRRVFVEAAAMPSRVRGRDPMLLLARSGFVTAAAAYPCTEWWRLDPQRIQEWLTSADGLRRDLEAARVDGVGADARIAASIRTDVLQAYAQLVLFYAQEVLDLRLPAVTHVPSRSPMGILLEHARRSLKAVAASRPPDVRLYEQLACAALLAGDWVEARRYGEDGIRIGGAGSEILGYAAAAGACVAGGPANDAEAGVYYVLTARHALEEWNGVASTMAIPRPRPPRYISN
jgi:hypothetical protein